jgi:hypothetical protein
MATLKTTEPDFFLNSENQVGFQNGKSFFFKNEEEPGRFLEPASKIGIHSSHKKARATQHYSKG